jgi:hypothetical protein
MPDDDRLISVKVPADLRAWLADYAKARDLTVSQVVRHQLTDLRTRTQETEDA